MSAAPTAGTGARTARRARRRRGALAAAGAAVALGALGALPAVSAAASPYRPGSARLEGSFLLAGHVTVAASVRGEHPGQALLRTWRFRSLCPSGPCRTVILVRPRAAGTDVVTLHRRAPGYYTGSGRFYRPLRCGSRIYRPGERVPFTIAVRITTAILSGGQVVAARVNASYVNPGRANLTPCVAYLGHDAARYHGHLVLRPAG